MSAARYTLVSVVVLCCLSVILSRPHEKKHKHRWHPDRHSEVKDKTKRDIVLSDETHHQELILPKDNGVNLAFDILTPASINKAEKTENKYNVFLDQEAITFDSNSKQNEVDDGKKDPLWHNLYEIKEPDNKISNTIVQNKKPVSTENTFTNKDANQNTQTATSVQNEGKTFNNSLNELKNTQSVKSDKAPDTQTVKSDKEPGTQNVKSDKEPDTQNVKSDKEPDTQNVKSDKVPVVSSHVENSNSKGNNTVADETVEDEDGVEDDYYDYYNGNDYNDFEKEEKNKEEVKKVEHAESNTTEIESKADTIQDTFENLIKEIYGGVLPYSASIENIKKQLEDSEKKAEHKIVKKGHVKDNRKTHTSADSKVNKSEVDKAKGMEKSNLTGSEYKDGNVFKLSDNKQLYFHQDMLENVDKLMEQHDVSKEVKTTVATEKTSTQQPSTTTKMPNSSTSNVVSSSSDNINTGKGGEKQTSKLNPSFKTPNIAETSPNPPTTKAVSITAAPIKGVREYIQSKPLQLCLDDGGCSPGRVCHNGVCVCGEATLCQGHHKVAVCGSDGQLYPSHCELHRQACLKQIHIRVNHAADCGQSLTEHFKVQPTYQGTHCEYRLFKGQEGILWGDILAPAPVKSVLECSDICDKKSFSGGCFAFQYSEAKNGLCFLFEKPTDIIRHPNSDMDFYEQRRCKPNPDVQCDYEPINLVSDHIYAMCNVKTSTGKSFDECQDACGNCTAFTYRKDDKICDIHNSKACIDMMNALGIVHYMKRCNEKGDICHILEVIPGKSPFMCSKATSSVSSLIECHDACVHGRCEAFQYLTKGDKTTCEIFFDKSCLELLDKKKENYYVKRCTNPKDCNYQQIQSASMMPCRVTSSDMDTMEKCRNMCDVDECFGYTYNYDSLDCSLYSDQSCVLGRNLNYVVRKCQNKQDMKQDVPKLTEVPTVKPVQNQEGMENRKEDKPVDQTKLESVKDVKQPDNSKTTTLTPPTTKGPYSSMPKSLKDDVVCTHEDYIQFKSDLLRYHCVRFRESNCDQNVIPNKGYIASLMFSYYDRDMNGDIGSDELWEMQVAENLEHISTICTLLDILKFEADDKTLDHTQFLEAFDAVLKEELEIIPVTATAGNGLEIKCGVEKTENPEIVWRRNNIDLTTLSIPDMAVFSDGTLYFESVGLHHTGNFTCNDKVKPGVKQIHMLNVNLQPIVRVSPSQYTLEMNQVDVFIDCHVDGIPQPRVQWEINNEPIPNNKPNHYITTHNNGTLIIHDSNISRDAGSYKCSATNLAGTSKETATVNKPGTPKARKFEAFYVLHKNGYTAYQPEGCETIRHVKGDFGNLKYIPEELDRAPSMCGLGQACVWGEAVNVQNKYIYASQPEQNRVIIIDVVNTFNPVQFVKTDRFPVKLYYVEHFDEVWILCWNANQESGSKTVVVIRDASKDIRHHVVHTQPIGYRFDLVEDIFVPPQNYLGHKFKHGYVIHSKQRGLYKVDLESMRYTRALEFERQDCIPKSVAFVPIGGYIVVECHRPVQLILDYITDTVVSNVSVRGIPYVSPDSRNLVFVDFVSGLVTVFGITDNGEMKKKYEVTTGASVSEAAFVPSDISTGYDMFLAAADTDSIYPIHLDNGQVTAITGKNEVRSEPVWPWSRTVRSIVSGDIFSQYIAAPSKSTIDIINGRDKRIHCSFEHLDSPDQIVYTNTILS